MTMTRLGKVFVGFAAALSLAACTAPDATPGAVPPPPEDEVGAVSLQLSLDVKYVFTRFSYDISGNGFHAAATVDVANSTQLATVVGGIPFGHGYTAALTAVEATGKLMPCQGSATFDIAARAPVAVPVHLSCREVAGPPPPPPPPPPPSVPVPPGAAALLGALLAALGASRVRRHGRAALALALALSSSTLACDGSALDATATTDVGAARMALVVPPDINLATVRYRVDGPGSFTTMGMIDVSTSSTVSTVISPLPPGMNYAIDMMATGLDGVSMCVGSATFAISSRQTTMVLVHMMCREAPRQGTVRFGGALNVCPSIDSLGASPDEVLVGHSLSLQALAHDSDGLPSPLAYRWTASGGGLAGADAPNATLTCIAPGPVSVTLKVTDGDPTPGCADVMSLVVACSPAP